MNNDNRGKMLGKSRPRNSRRVSALGCLQSVSSFVPFASFYNLFTSAYKSHVRPLKMSADRKRDFADITPDTPQDHLVQNASGTFLSTDPSADDGGKRAYEEVQESIAKKPLQLPPQESIQLWEKAKADQTSLTDDERLQILDRWPLDDFNKKCQGICGKTLEELLEKAVNSPKDLTKAESDVIIHGVEKRTLDHDPAMDRLRWPSDLRDLYRTARAAAETDRDRTAIKNAREAGDKSREQKSEARELLSDDDRKNIIWCNRSKWASRLNEERPGEQWGFALYRTFFEDDEAWTKFQERLESLTDTAFAFVTDSEEIRTRRKIHYIEDKELEDASIEKLAE